MLGSMWNDNSWDSPEIEEAKASLIEQEGWSRALTAAANKKASNPIMPDEFLGRLGLQPFRIRPLNHRLAMFYTELKTARLNATINIHALKVHVTVNWPFEAGGDMEIITLAHVGYNNRISLDELSVYPNGARHYVFH